MKNPLKFILILLFVGIASCTKEEVPSENPDANTSLSPLEDMQVDLLQESKNVAPGNSPENPIVVAADAFIDYVVYELQPCDGDEPLEYMRSQGQFYREFLHTVGLGAAVWRFSDDGCIENAGSLGTPINEYQAGLYYQIYGEVVSRSTFGLGIVPSKYPDRQATGFWFRELPDSDQVQKVFFSADGNKEFGEIVDAPYERNIDCSKLVAYDVVNNVPDEIADMTEERFVLRSHKGRFSPSNAVYTAIFDYQANATLRFYFASFRGFCAADSGEPIADPCEDVAPFHFLGQYKRGDQVTYRGYLFTKLRRGRGWRREAKCL